MESPAWLRHTQRVTVLTGAGISTESGIPDFRGPQGVWTRNPAAQALFTIDNYLADPDVRRQAWQARLSNPAWDAEPNAGHLAIVELERADRLRALITQNIDELHQRAGSAQDKVIEIHGTIFSVECLQCGLQTPTPEVLARVEAGEDDPPCLACGGILKTATISFGQTLKPGVFTAAVNAARDCEVFLAVGSSLTVHPAAGLCLEAIEYGARLIVVNAQATPYDEVAALVIRDPIGQALPALVATITA